jgi:hypothetical protein
MGPPASLSRRLRAAWRHGSKYDRQLIVLQLIAVPLAMIAGVKQRDFVWIGLSVGWLGEALWTLRDMVKALANLRAEASWERTRRVWAATGRAFRQSRKVS